MKRCMMVILICIAIMPCVSAANNATNYTISIIDEDTLSRIPFVYHISNDTDSLFDGRYTTYKEFTDPANIWAVANEEKGADRDDTTYTQFTCDNAGGCGANTLSYYLYAAAPYYKQESDNCVFNVSLKTTSANDISLYIKDQTTGVWDLVITRAGGAATTTSHKRTNVAGKYTKNGIAEFKIENGEAYLNTESFIVYDVWTMSGYYGIDNNINNYELKRDTGNSEELGGMPTGEVSIIVYADNYGTAEDYPERIFYATIPKDEYTFNLSYYLLLSSSGSTVTYNVYSGSYQTLSNALVSAQRNLNGSYITVAQGKTGDDGATNTFIKTNSNHQLITSKSSYATQTSMVNPSSSTTYSIVMRSISAAGFTSSLADIYYSFTPIHGTIDGGPNGSINLTVSAPNSNLESWGFNLTFFAINGSTSLISNQTSTSAAGGFMSSAFLTDNFSKYDRIHVDAFLKKIGYDRYDIDRDYMVITQTESNSSLYLVLQQLKAEESPFMVHIIALFISVFIAGFMRMIGFGGYGTGIIILAVLGFFVYAGFFNVTMYSIMILIVGCLYVIHQRGGL